MNGYHCFNFTEKRSYETTKKCQIFIWIYHWNFPKGGAYDFSGEVQKFPGEAQNFLTPPLKIQLWKAIYNAQNYANVKIWKAQNS